MTSLERILASLSPAPTALDIARKELHAAEEAWAARPPLKRGKYQHRLDLAERVVEARAAFASAHRAEFGEQP